MGGKTIAVIGATGLQGGGLMRAILSDPLGGYVARGVTRDPASEKARSLIDLGGEVAAGNLDDEESLVAAFSGCYGAYCMTNFWETMSPETEQAQAANLARAAKRAGLTHVIWSTLEDTREWVPLDDDRMPTLLERFKVPHYDAKGEADQYFRDEGVPTTFLRTSFYWDNFVGFGLEPQRDEKGDLVLTLPMGDRPLPGISASDIGRVAYAIFQEGEPWIGKTLSIAGGNLTGDEMAAEMSKVLDEEVTYRSIPFDVYRSLDFPGADELGNMFQVKHDFNEQYVGARDVEATRALYPDLTYFDEWLRAHRDEIPRH